MNIDDLLKDKEATHGLFDDTATIAQTLKAVMRRGTQLGEPAAGEQGGARADGHQGGAHPQRRCDGPEHWNDIAGYARLRANAFVPGYRRPAVAVDHDLESGISTIARKLRPARVNDEGGAA